MDPRAKPWLWTGAAVIAVALVAFAVRGTRPQAPAEPAVATPVAADADAGAPGDQPAPASSGDVLPWEQAGNAAPTGTTPSASLAARAFTAGQPVMTQEQATAAVSTMRQQSRENIRAADDLLRQLDALEKSGQAPADVSLDALRNNLQVAKRAQSLALELAESTQLPDSPQRRERHAVIVEELRQLQGQLRYDVGTGLPVPAAQPRTP